VHLPKISIITPSFNQAAFLERTILSVLDQGYVNIEYIIIDGGSTDGSIDIIRKYADRLSYWISEADRGQAHAINKGLKRATGEWVAWQNSDDIFYPGAFSQMAQTAAKKPNVDLIIGNMNLIDKDDVILRDIKYVQPTYWSMLAEGMVLSNQAAFWRRDVHSQIGFLDEGLDCIFDFEWFLRLLHNKRNTIHVPSIWGALRLHDETKTSNRQHVFEAEFQKVLDGREPSTWQVRLFQLRRMVLMLKDGEITYLLRGARKRLRTYIESKKL
jgi:glycosyltransferase involved in cell wall biosynthesis